jgi:hypothetical protein
MGLRFEAMKKESRCWVDEAYVNPNRVEYVLILNLKVINIFQFCIIMADS